MAARSKTENVTLTRTITHHVGTPEEFTEPYPGTKRGGEIHTEFKVAAKIVTVFEPDEAELLLGLLRGSLAMSHVTTFDPDQIREQARQQILLYRILERMGLTMSQIRLLEA